MRIIGLILAAVGLVLAPPAKVRAACAGDCGGDLRVTVDEVILGINIVLGLAPLGQCDAVDANGDGAATVADLVLAVGSVLAGCTDSSPTPTPTPGVGPVGRIVFMSVDQTTFQGDLFVIEADGSGRANLTNTADRGEGQPSWSPEGQRIAFTVDNTAIAVMNADGSGRRTVVEGDARVGYPAWSRDGSAIVFASADFHSIETVDVDSGRRTVIVPADAFEYLAPTFSPDDSVIAFASDRATGSGGEGLEILSVAAGGGEVSRLTDDETENASLDWSVNGQIAFGSFRQSPAPNSAIYAVDADGTDERLLVGDAMFPAWSADGATLVFSSFNGIGLASADGSGQRVVPNTTSQDVDPDVQ